MKLLEAFRVNLLWCPSKPSGSTFFGAPRSLQDQPALVPLEAFRVTFFARSLQDQPALVPFEAFRVNLLRCPSKPPGSTCFGAPRSLQGQPSLVPLTFFGAPPSLQDQPSLKPLEAFRVNLLWCPSKPPALVPLEAFRVNLLWSSKPPGSTCFGAPRSLQDQPSLKPLEAFRINLLWCPSKPYVEFHFISLRDKKIDQPCEQKA